MSAEHARAGEIASTVVHRYEVEVSCRCGASFRHDADANTLGLAKTLVVRALERHLELCRAREAELAEREAERMAATLR